MSFDRIASRFTTLSRIASGLIVFHLVVVSFVWVFNVGALLSGLLVLACALLAAMSCFAAFHQRPQRSGSFWMLAGWSLILWSIGQALDLFNEFYLVSPEINPPALLVLFFVSFAPIALPVLPGDDSRPRSLSHLFALLQIAAVIGAASWLYLFAVGGFSGYALRAVRLAILDFRNVFIVASLVVRALLSTTRENRQVFAGMGTLIAAYSLAAALGNRALELWGFRSGSWSDLMWSLPFALIAIFAAEWAARNPVFAIFHIPVASGRIQSMARRFAPAILPILTIAIVCLITPKAPLIVSVTFSACLIGTIGNHLLELRRHDKVLLELNGALEGVKTLSGILPICATCKKIRGRSGEWQYLETYIRQNSEAEFSHGICPACAERFCSEESQRGTCAK